VFGVKWRCQTCGYVWDQSLIRNIAGTPTCPHCGSTCDPAMELSNLATTAAAGQTPVFVNLGSSGIDSPKAEGEILRVNKPRKIRW
jgi:NAD-dependent SIR2 family protein deacetylase